MQCLFNTILLSCVFMWGIVRIGFILHYFLFLLGWLCAAFRTLSAVLEVLGSAVHQFQIDDTEFEVSVMTV